MGKSRHDTRISVNLELVMFETISSYFYVKMKDEYVGIVMADDLPDDTVKAIYEVALND